MDNYYDACVGWTPTISRIQVFDFSMPFFKIAKIFFYKKKGGSFDPTQSLDGKTIGRPIKLNIILFYIGNRLYALQALE